MPLSALALLLWIAAILTIYTGFDYFRAGLKYVISEQMQ